MAKPISRKNIRSYVDFIRKITKTEKVLYFPVVDFVELILPQILDNFQYEICSINEMPNKCGETFPYECKIKIREDIYLKAINGDGFARYCVAHEVGHMLINDIDSISLCKLENGEKLKAYKDPEWQADCFAGELLMYYPLVKNFNEHQIEIKCGVTARAAKVQKSKM